MKLDNFQRNQNDFQRVYNDSQNLVRGLPSKVYVNDHTCVAFKKVVDSGCSSHMTGNKAYLSDYEDLNIGFVAIGSDPKGGLIVKLISMNLRMDRSSPGKYNSFMVLASIDSKEYTITKASSEVNSNWQSTGNTYFIFDAKNIVLESPPWGMLLRCMRTRSQTRNRNRRQQQQTLPVVIEPCNLEEPIPGQTIVAMAERTYGELLPAPTEVRKKLLFYPRSMHHSRSKLILLQLVQANPFHGLENENPHAHIKSFQKDYFDLNDFRNVPNDVIKLMMFPYSLEEAAKTCFFQAQASPSGTLPSNTIPNPKGEMKAITTRSGVAYEGPSNPTKPSPKKVVERETEEITDEEQNDFQGSTAQIPPLVIPKPIPEPEIPKTLPKSTPISEPEIPKTVPKANIPYPSRRDNQKNREKASYQKEKIFQMFQDLRWVGYKSKSFVGVYMDTKLLIPQCLVMKDPPAIHSVNPRSKATAYHPQTSGQVEVSNRGLKRILERTEFSFGEVSRYLVIKHVILREDTQSFSFGNFDRYGYMKSHMKTVKNGQTRTQERKSEQKPKAKTRKSLEKQLNHNVKIIRYDNGTEFKNHAMNEFCAKKGIKREFSVARTPRQNEAVNTACYVLNRVLVTKPHNKIPYELLIGKSPNISFMRPFGCPLTILNTLHSLGKFDGKSNEGYLLGYSTSNKAFRVYNKTTKRVEENLHINFLEDQPNVAGTGLNWMFDLDFLTNSINYIPISVENQVNMDAGTQDSYVAGSSGKDK
ncbi:putative ribonuclease H-like domain-containing protein [Tanacetum coccineum]